MFDEGALLTDPGHNDKWRRFVPNEMLPAKDRGVLDQAQENKLPLPTQRSLTGLTPILDGAGLLQVLGCLRHADLPFDRKHPWLLPDSRRLARLMVKKAHRATLARLTSCAVGSDPGNILDYSVETAVQEGDQWMSALCESN